MYLVVGHHFIAFSFHINRIWCASSSLNERHRTTRLIAREALHFLFSIL